MNEKVTLIPARRKNNRINVSQNEKTKVAAYCRVSTDSDEQAGSYDIQVKHYTEYIGRNPLWELAGIYTDDGISGTNTKKRDGFNEMITDCLKGKIDLVITKSISRFARNTIDCLKYVRQLKEKNIAIVFEKENINTLEASGELLLTIMASLAQQESASLSQNVKMGLQFRYQEGKVQVNHNYFLGYTKDANGDLVIVEKEAKVIKRIFREYLEGASFKNIADGLEKDEIKTGSGGKKWHVSTVRGILTNEKYMGDALLQKTITTDFIDKTRIRNDGSIPQYYVKDSHDPIIPKDLFLLVQEEISRRTNLVSGDETKKKRTYSSKYALSSICKCGYCGDIYRRIKWNNRGKKSTVWRCCNRVENGPEACNSRTILEEELQLTVIESINKLLSFTEEDKEVLFRNIEEVISVDNSEEIIEINKQLRDKQKKLIKLSQEKKDYTEIAYEIDELREVRQKIQIATAEKENIKKKIHEIRSFLQNTETEIIEFDEALVRKYINEVLIYDDRYLVKFKSGIEISI